MKYDAEMNKPTDFDDLKDFILDRKRMSMSYIYKPVMLQAVLKHGGQATKEQIAAEIMARDVVQIEHYRQKVVHQSPGNRLVRDGVLIKEGETYRLDDRFADLSQSQLLELLAVCERRIEEHVLVHGHQLSSRNTDPVPGTARYEVLKRAGGRCELCGASIIEGQIDVDHIVPRTPLDGPSGSNDPSNLQALCRTCNAQKRNLDDTDFRAVNASYADRQQACPFCDADDRVVDENELAVVIEDGHSVTRGHSLVIPRRHIADYFDLHQAERNAIDQLLRDRRDMLTAADDEIKGFNVGVNVGQAAGQTVFHVHVHLIPRRIGDVDDPTGGVRGVIPSEQKY
jgi:ATP adenylyltransferase